MVSVIDWRKYLCKTSKITCRHASNQQTRNTTWNIQYCYLLWSRKKVQSIQITLEWNDSFGFVTRFILCINRQSFYRNRKRQLVPTDRYRFRTIGKLIGSVSHDRVPYRYLDALPKTERQTWCHLRKNRRVRFSFCTKHHFLKTYLYVKCINFYTEKFWKARKVLLWHVLRNLLFDHYSAIDQI